MDALRRRLTNPWTAAALQMILGAAFLLMVCNQKLAYEEDSLAKEAQLIALGSDSNWRHAGDVPSYYRRDNFSAWYFAVLAFQKASGLAPLRAPNLFSVLCGAAFLAVMPAFLKRALGLPSWLSWFVFLNAPAVVVLFIYGNEAAFAIAVTALAALALTADCAVAAAAAGILFGVAVYSRSDYLLLWPALCLAAFLPAADGGARSGGLRRALIFNGSAAVFGLGYLALVLHHVPFARLDASNHNLKVVLGFLLYSPNPVLLLFAAGGLLLCVARRERRALWFLVVLIQAIPYATMLTSPKYIMPSIVVALVFAIIAIREWLARFAAVILPLMALPWFVALTPFGVFGPARGPFWYMPTDAGPLPTGSYASFYGRVHEGFYQRRYDVEYDQLDLAMRELNSEPSRTLLAGHFNVQTLRLWAVRNNRPDIPPDGALFWDIHIQRGNNQTRYLLLKAGYLYPVRQTPDACDRINAYLASGAIVPLGTAKDPFPDVIEIGPTVAAGGATDLGKRILFFNQYWGGNQPFRRDEFIGDLAGVSWINRAEYDARQGALPKPLYIDGEWAAFSEPVEGALYYSLRYPRRFGQLR
jgi:hypothetical protein